MITLILATAALIWLYRSGIMDSGWLNQFAESLFKWILLGCWLLLMLETSRKVLLKWF
jgi:hypothetical protein